MCWLTYLLSLCLYVGVQSGDNMFLLNSKNVTADRALGQICFSYNTYIPSCGWTLALSANKNLSGVMVDGVTIARQTPSMFQLISTTCNKNLSSTPADLCLNVTLYGLFNNIKPYVVACWQRICNSSTNGVQQLVSYFGPYVGQSYPANETGYVMTVMAPPTLSSVLGLCPSASMSSFASLELAGNFCYNGQHQVTYRNTSSHTSCSLLCLNCPLCLGVSFVSSLNLCHVITEDTDLNPGLLDNSTNCLYFSVTTRG